MRLITAEERRWRLVRRHLLAPGAQVTEVSDVATALVGLHSSDPSSVYLAARARLVDPTVEVVERALYEDRSVVRVLGMRRTMFVVPSEMASLLHHACARPLAAAERRRTMRLVEEEGITEDPGPWLERVEQATLRAVAERGEAVATELVDDVPELGEKLTFGHGKSWGGQMGLSTRVLFLLATAGEIVRARPRGSWISSQYRWALMGSWLPGGLDEVPPDEGRAVLVGHWLASFGPGTFADLKWWTGWTKAQVGAALDRVGAVEVEVDGSPAYVHPDDLDPVEQAEPRVVLLPALDSTVMGWYEREWYLGPHRPILFDRNGNAGATVWWDGRVVGGWGVRPDGEVVYRLLEDVGREVVESVVEESAALARWLGGVVVVPRFRTPLEKELTV